MNDITAIFAFLKYCLGYKGDMSRVIAGMNWHELYSFASKQALLGLCFDGIERLGKEYPEELKRNPIGRELLMNWMGKAQQIRRQNMKVNVVAGKLFSMLRLDGLRCCILKGQGNALMYPNAYSRNPGDVDVWVNVSREQITEYAKKHFKLGDDIRYQHIETSVDGVPVELHFFPCTMNNPLYHARLQKWFRRNADLQCSHIVGLPDGAGDIAIPTTAFNVIYQLTHLYHHFFDEGIGMRQIIDYYYVVCDFYKVYQNSSKITPSLFFDKASCTRQFESELSLHSLASLFPIKEGSTSHPDPLTLRGEGGNRPTRCSEPLRSKDGGPKRSTPDSAGWDRRDAIGDMTSATASTDSSATAARSSSTAIDRVQEELKELGLWKFAGAIMYIMQEVFGMPASRLIVPPNEKYGRFVLNEVLEAGNFGRHDARNRFGRSQLGHNLQRVYRDIRLVRYFPAEALCEPFFRVWHYFWRLKHRRQSLGVFS